MSLRFRINLLVTVLLLAFMVAAGWLIAQDMRRAIREEVSAATSVTDKLLRTAVYSSQFMPHRGPPYQVILDFLNHLGRVRAHEIRLYDTPGSLIYTSPPSTYKSGREAPEWFARVVRPHIEPLEMVVPGGRLVVTPDPSRSILDAWDDLKPLMAIGAGFFVLANALVFWFVGRALRPLSMVLRGLSQMEQGMLEARLPAFDLPEMSAIGHTFNRMAEALERGSEENRRLALIAQQTGDAILIQLPGGAISFWNPAAERLFGYGADEMAARRHEIIVPESERETFRRQVEAVGRREVLEYVETRRLRRDGTEVEVAVSAAPLVDPRSERVMGQIWSMRDITEKKRAEQAARDLRENRELTQIIQAHVEEERKKIARELHDELGQCATGIRTIAVSITNRTRESQPELAASAQAIAEVASRIFDVTHGIIRELRPAELDSLGLAEALGEMAADHRVRHPETELELDLPADIHDLPEKVTLTVYRVVQECLTNVVRHSRARRVTVGMGRDTAEGCLRVEVRDDGVGMEAQDRLPSGHYGLLGIRERVQALGGQLAVETAPGRGFAVKVTIPLEAERS